VIFTSDNGGVATAEGSPTSNAPLRDGKGFCYEGGIRVPFIARWPGHITPNTTTDFPTAFWDFLPTAADLANVNLHDPSFIFHHPSLRTGLDGQSILPTLLGKLQQPQPYLYWEFHERGFDQALRIGDFKAIRHGTTKPIELYNLTTDPAESTDLAPTHPDLVRRAAELFTTARTDSKDFPIDDSPRKKSVQPQE
jgi:arylsulfatase A-like enzyme